MPARAAWILAGLAVALSGCGDQAATTATTAPTDPPPPAATSAPAESLPLREIRTPSGEPVGGTVVVLHGGSWSRTGVVALATTHAAVDRFRAWGLRTVNADYRPGQDGLRDVLRAIDHETDRPGARVCVYGESAGGLWALLAAARRPALRCVIAVAAPTDLVEIPASSTLGRVSREVFGPRAREYSPTASADALTVPVLLGYATSDTTVPAAQGELLHARVTSSALRILAPGRTRWLHTTVSPASLSALHAQERRLLIRALGG